MLSSPRRRGLLTALLVAAAVPLATPGMARAAGPHDHPGAPRVAHARDPLAVTTTTGAARLRADALRTAVGTS